MSVAMDHRSVPSGQQQQQYPPQYPPLQQQQQTTAQQQAAAAAAQRPRSKSTWSFKSDKSGGQNKGEHNRTVSQEKAHLHPSTKADPNAAMAEKQPIAEALEKPTLQSLRSFSHNDANGNPIAEPDLSNPTRSRWERPLDTIRSFEAAIDGEYRRRSRVVQGAGGDGTDVMSSYGGASRRSSYYGGGGHDQNRYSQVSGYHGGGRGNRDSYFDPNGMGGPVGGPPRTRNNRMQSDPGWNRYSQGGNGVYPSHGYQQSRDTVNTNGSNGSHSDPHTEPGSDNSSFERAPPVARPDPAEQYGFQGFGGGAILEEYPAAQNQGGYPVQPSHGANNFNGQNGYNGQNGHGAPPPVPQKAAPIKLGQSDGASSANGAGRPAVLQRQSTDKGDKRKSWFKRRFSKD